MDKTTSTVTKERVMEDLKIYGIMQRKIKDYKEQIEQIEIVGISKSSKDITSFNADDGYITDTPEIIKIQGIIKHLEHEINKYMLECIKVESALKSIKNNEFYKAFYEIYVSGKGSTPKDMAKYKEYEHYHEESIRYHMNKLLTRIAQELYPEFSSKMA